MANSLDTKAQNITNILKIIRIHGETNKPFLAQQTGLTASTVHLIVSQLESEGMIQCCATASSTGGRKAFLYRIHKNYRLLIGICIRLTHIHIALMDLDLNLIDSKDIPYLIHEHTPEHAIAETAKTLEQLLLENKISEDKIGGIGINVPGPVDTKNGIVLDISGAKNWAGFPLQNRLSLRYSCPVYVSKDINDGMYYLGYFNAFDQEKSRVCVSIYDGISAALLINGKIYCGSHSLAGEIGHITVRRDGPVCRCGNMGCLELYCSDHGILNLYNSAHPSDVPLQDITKVILAAQQGDSVASDIITQAVKYLSEIIATIMLMYDPDDIVINSRWLHIQEHMFLDILERLSKKGMFARRQSINLELIDNKDIYLLGAAAHVATMQYFSPEGLSNILNIK